MTAERGEGEEEAHRIVEREKGERVHRSVCGKGREGKATVLLGKMGEEVMTTEVEGEHRKKRRVMVGEERRCRKRAMEEKELQKKTRELHFQAHPQSLVKLRCQTPCSDNVAS